MSSYYPLKMSSKNLYFYRTFHRTKSQAWTHSPRGKITKRGKATKQAWTQSTRVNNQAWQSHETSAAQGHETSADTRPTNNKRDNKSHDYQAWDDTHEYQASSRLTMTRQGLTVPLLATGVLYQVPSKQFSSMQGSALNHSMNKFFHVPKYSFNEYFRKQSPCMKTFQYKFTPVTIVLV